MKPPSRFLPFAIALAALALPGLMANAQPTATPHMPRAAGPAGLAMGDRVFLKEAAEVSRFEVDASQLALHSAASPKVRDYAALLVRDHKETGAGLLRLAHARGLTPPLMTGGHRKTLSQLAKAHGAGFDRVFLEKVGLEAHRDGIRSFEAAGNEVRDAELKAWIGATLPVMREHLAQAQKLAGKR
jgi:putative membrane protein